MVVGIPRSYDPERVVFSIGGVPITGIAEGQEMRFEPTDAEKYTVVGNIDNDDTVRIRKRGSSRGTITCPVSFGSPSNAYLQQISSADDLTGAGYLPFVLKNTVDGTVISGNAFVNSIVSVAKGAGESAAYYEWTISVTQVAERVQSLNIAG